ncbi:MAG: alpha-beta hydrolase superfamily lysophospholipase [Flavobacteriales bacterium]|jgi:alpha-beta hydrolase superfamily lysophospholipase
MMNIVAFFHAYKFTHFVSENHTKTKSPEKLNSFDKIKTLLLGVNNPRPINAIKPDKYSTLELQSNKKIECWYLNNGNSDSIKGTVILFHGYSGEKSSMLDKAEEFEELNYDVLLVDFMGSGGSEGNQTTLGFKEAEEVKTAYEYLINRGEKNIYLFGTSMGSVAIMKGIADYDLKPKGIIIECPFGSMYKTTCARFKIMNAPTFPMAGLLVFWGGVQNNFWALGHNPTEYAKKINCPTLLLYGEQDKNVSRQEIDEIYLNLKGRKKLRTYELAGHENYLIKYKEQWTTDINNFLCK